MLGLGAKEEPKAKKKDAKKSDASANDEAKKILAQMEAKKDAGDCPFC